MEEIIKTMRKIAEDHPLALEYESDARDTWPKRWEALESYIKENLVSLDYKPSQKKIEEPEISVLRQDGVY